MPNNRKYISTEYGLINLRDGDRIVHLDPEVLAELYWEVQDEKLVRVVRCKDCKHFSFWCELHETRVDPDVDYCSWAEGYKRCPFCGAKMDEVGND